MMSYLKLIPNTYIPGVDADKKIENSWSFVDIPEGFLMVQI